KWIAFSVEVKAVRGFVNSANSPLRIGVYNGAKLGGTNSTVGSFTSTEYNRIRFEARQITELPEGGYFRTLLWPSGASANQGFRFRRWIVVVADTEEEANLAASTYFDGESEDKSSTTKYKWTGAVGNSPSQEVKIVPRAKYRWLGTANASVSEEYMTATPFIPGFEINPGKLETEIYDSQSFWQRLEL